MGEVRRALEGNAKLRQEVNDMKQQLTDFREQMTRGVGQQGSSENLMKTLRDKQKEMKEIKKRDAGQSKAESDRYGEN